MKCRGFCLGLLLLALCLPATAHAKDWSVDYPHSRLGFTGSQGGAAFEGWFNRYIATIDFDPAHPEKGKITAIIDTGSATANSSDRDEMLPQADWFNVSKFPQARFESTAIRSTGEHAYEADGTLTIKGVEKKITLPFTLVQEGTHWRAEGKVPLLRTDFGVGQGEWASEKVVKAAVDVTISLSATPPS